MIGQNSEVKSVLVEYHSDETIIVNIKLNNTNKRNISHSPPLPPLSNFNNPSGSVAFEHIQRGESIIPLPFFKT